jgi:hypothetical protein
VSVGSEKRARCCPPVLSWKLRRFDVRDVDCASVSGYPQSLSGMIRRWGRSSELQKWRRPICCPKTR